MSSPMIAWLPAVNRVYKYLTNISANDSRTIDIPSVEIHDVETAPEKRPRTLKHLLKANHINHAVFFHNLQFHNHMPHILGSAYLLGANPDQLQHVYDEESKGLVEWEDAPGEVSDNDWRDFLGDRTYQRAYVDFFEDELALKFQYNWRHVAEKYLYEGPNPLINCLITGLGHPLIHLGYAFEFSSREVCMEALTLIACSYNYLHKYIDNESYTNPAPNPSTSPVELLHRISDDERFNDLFKKPLGDDVDTISETKGFEPLLLEYWNAWEIADPKMQFQQSQEAAVALLVSTVQTEKDKYDFFLVHLLTTSHAVRILLPLVPGKFHMNLVRQWWLLTVSTYIGQMRPKFDEKTIESVNLKDKNWKYVEDKAVNGEWRTDAHFVKSIRAMKEAAATWGDENSWYLKSAVKLADGFTGWGGFE